MKDDPGPPAPADSEVAGQDEPILAGFLRDRRTQPGAGTAARAGLRVSRAPAGRAAPRSPKPRVRRPDARAQLPPLPDSCAHKARHDARGPLVPDVADSGTSDSEALGPPRHPNRPFGKYFPVLQPRVPALVNEARPGTPRAYSRRTCHCRCGSPGIRWGAGTQIETLPPTVSQAGVLVGGHPWRGGTSSSLHNTAAWSRPSRPKARLCHGLVCDPGRPPWNPQLASLEDGVTPRAT